MKLVVGDFLKDVNGKTSHQLVHAVSTAISSSSVALRSIINIKLSCSRRGTSVSAIIYYVDNAKAMVPTRRVRQHVATSLESSPQVVKLCFSGVEPQHYAEVECSINAICCHKCSIAGPHRF